MAKKAQSSKAKQTKGSQYTADETTGIPIASPLSELIQQTVEQMTKTATKSNGKLVGTTDVPLIDPRTGAKVLDIRLTLSDLLQILKLQNNFYQRKLQNHFTDKIYKKLIISILQGHLIPALRVGIIKDHHKVESFKEAEFKSGKYDSSIIDGLQRFACYLLALVLIEHGEELVEKKIIKHDVYEQFRPFLGKNAMKQVLNAPVRLELYYNIEIRHLLLYMIIFNTAQRRMSLAHQMEIMQEQLLDNLQNQYGVVFKRDNTPGSAKNGVFKGSEITLVMQAFLSGDHLIKMSDAADSIFWELKDDTDTADDRIDILSESLAFLVNELHPLVQKFYGNGDEPEPRQMYVLSSSIALFVVPMMASLGQFCLDDENKKLYDHWDRSPMPALKRIEKLLKSNVNVLQLEKYFEISDSINSRRGPTIRNITEKAFRDFWTSGSSKALNWASAARSENVG
jgi:hypothetical protein